VHRPRPLSLRTVLDAGCDLAASGVWLEDLAEDLYILLPTLPPAERRRRAEAYAGEVEDLLARGEKSRGPKRRTFQQCVTLAQWRAEIFEDRDLAERLRTALPSEVADRYRSVAECWRRLHPLAVRVPEMWWHCNNCGAAFDQGEREALVVTDRSLDYEIRYCADCVALVAAVLHQADGS
jgi:hypothetical protein